MTRRQAHPHERISSAIVVLSFNLVEWATLAIITALHFTDTPVRVYLDSMEPIAKTIIDCARRTVV
jgi:hypothetical protein